MSDLGYTPPVANRETLQLRSASIHVVRPVILEVIEGPRRGARYGPHRLPIRIGAAPGNEVRLDDPSVSRHHCTIEEGKEGLVLRDTGSTNGVVLGGHRVMTAVVQDGSQIRLGQSVLQLKLGDGEPETSQTINTEAFGRLAGQSSAMQQLIRTLARVAPTRVPVLIEGETGTGKELAARALHEQGGRPSAPFVVVDLGATAPALIESALFGHEKGAFTGAETQRDGAFVAAHGGTVFLDEVGELPLDLQPKLLRALEAQTVTPLGAVQPQSFDVRVVAATHRNLQRMVNDGLFREDLYFRLAVCPVRVPSLKERREDIPILSQAIFLEALALLEETPAHTPQLEPGAVAWLQRQPWPGNVRELRNIIQRAVILGGLEDVQQGRLAEALDRAALGQYGTSTAPTSLEDAKRNFERAYLLELLRRHNGDRHAAADEADIHVKSLQRLVRRHGLKGEVP